MTPKIILKRTADNFGRWRKYRVFVDGLKVGTISYGENRHFSVKPGRHRVQVSIDWWRSNLVSIEVEGNSAFHLECGSNWKGWRLTLSLLIPLFLFWPNGWLWLRAVPKNARHAE